MTITSPSIIVVGKSGFRDLIIVTAYGCGSARMRFSQVRSRCVHFIQTVQFVCVCRMRMREHPRTCARMCVNSRPTPRQGMRFPIHALKRVACLVRRRSLLRRSTMRRRRCLCIRCWARLPLYAHTNKYTDSHTHTHWHTVVWNTLALAHTHMA